MDPADVHATRRTALRAIGAGIASAGAVGTAAAATLSVTTDWADKLADDEWLLGGTLDGLGDASEATCYFEFRPEGGDAWRSTSATTLTSAGDFTASTGTVDPGVSYEYRAVAETSSDRVTGAVDTFYTYADPTVTTADATDVTESSATLSGSLDDLGSADSCTVWFDYRVSGGSWQSSATEEYAEPWQFTIDVGGLSPGTEYEYRARAEGDDGTYGYGDRRTFTTDSTLAVTTDAATDVEETAATLQGTLADLGGADSASVYFTLYDPSTSEGTRVEAGKTSTTGAFEARATGLDPETTYEFVAAAEASDGDAARGESISFGTDAALSVETTGAVDVEPTGATLTADLRDLGDADTVDMAFEYRRTGASSWVDAGTESVASTGSVERRVDGLADGADYEYRTTATASDGDVDGGGTATFSTPVGNHAPTVESLTGSESSPPNPHAELHVEWSVADADGNLSAVEVTVRDAGGRTVHSSRTAVAGGDASGSEYTEVKKGAGETYTATVVVTDAEGATGSDRTTIRA